MIDRPPTLFSAIASVGHDLDFEPLYIPEPTAARPGSQEKLQVFMARLEAGEDLYHWGDEQIAATAEDQTLMILYARMHSKGIRDSKRAGRETARSFANANAVKARLRER